MLEAISDTSIVILFVGLLLAIFVFVFSIYFFNKKRLKKFVIFDISIVIIFISLVTARLLGMINNWNEYSNLGFSFFPLEEIAGMVRIVDAMPWEFFKVNDGNFYVWGISIGVIIAIGLIYLVSNKSKEYFDFADGIIMAFLPVKIILLITQFISLTYYGKGTSILNIYIPFINDNRANLGLIELIIFLLVFVVLLIVKLKVSKNGIVYLIFILYESLIGFFVISNVFYSNELVANLQTSQVVSILLLIFVVVWVVLTVLAQAIGKRRKLAPTQRVISSDNLIKRTELSDFEMSSSKSIIDRIKNIFK